MHTLNTCAFCCDFITVMVAALFHCIVSQVKYPDNTIVLENARMTSAELIKTQPLHFAVLFDINVIM